MMSEIVCTNLDCEANEYYRCTCKLIEVNKKNRDNLPEIIFKKMFKTSKRKP